jgi:hypothetical protein
MNKSFSCLLLGSQPGASGLPSFPSGRLAPRGAGDHRVLRRVGAGNPVSPAGAGLPGAPPSLRDRP